MESLVAPNHRESILTVLSRVPIATTKQLSTLNDSLDPKKKASKVLRELEQDGLVQWKYHGQEKVWSLTKKGRHLFQSQPQRLNNVDHSLAVINLFFTMRPKFWIFEPVERFTHGDKKCVWVPDCILSHKNQAFAVEVQLTPLGKKAWEKKWHYYNLFFNNDYYKNAAYQKWGKRVFMPEFIVVTNQRPETVKQGFEIVGRELIVCREFK